MIWMFMLSLANNIAATPLTLFTFVEWILHILLSLLHQFAESKLFQSCTTTCFMWRWTCSSSSQLQLSPPPSWPTAGSSRCQRWCRRERRRCWSRLPSRTPSSSLPGCAATAEEEGASAEYYSVLHFISFFSAILLPILQFYSILISTFEYLFIHVLCK